MRYILLFRLENEQRLSPKKLTVQDHCLEINSGRLVNYWMKETRYK